MPRPVTYTEPRKVVSVRLPVSLQEDIQREAKRRRISFNLAVILALEGWLNPSIYCDF